MPPRWLTVLIVVVWLLTSGRLAVRDLLPRFLPGQAPPYTIDLVEEARTRKLPNSWSVSCNNRRVFRASCRVLHPEADVFELTAEFTPASVPGSLRRGEPVPLHGMLIEKLLSTYRVNARGDLLGVGVEIEGTPQAALFQFLRVPSARIVVEGEVHEGRLRPILRGGFRDHPDTTKQLSLPEVRVNSGGSVLLPLHPVNRLLGISPGQSWQMTVVDPLGDSLAALSGGGEPRYLRARVRPEPQPLGRGRRQNLLCLVIDYEGDDFQGSTWVEKERGLVLCQEAKLGGDNWVMVRD